jgi:hypothetical protein
LHRSILVRHGDSCVRHAPIPRYSSHYAIKRKGRENFPEPGSGSCLTANSVKPKIIQVYLLQTQTLLPTIFHRLYPPRRRRRPQALKPRFQLIHRFRRHYLSSLLLPCRRTPDVLPTRSLRRAMLASMQFQPPLMHIRLRSHCPVPLVPFPSPSSCKEKHQRRHQDNKDSGPDSYPRLRCGAETRSACFVVTLKLRPLSSISFPIQSTTRRNDVTCAEQTTPVVHKGDCSPLAR